MKKMALLFILVMAFAVGGTAYGKGYIVADDLWVRAVINTVDGPIDAVLYKGGENKTESGCTVIWGYFYASPSDVSWGSEDNPDLYVKIWFDVSGRIDVNFFHVSVPSIDVYTDYPYDGSYDKRGTTTMASRYVRHEYQLQDPTADSCENIDGKWRLSGTLDMTATASGETIMSKSSSFSESVSIAQTGCSVKVDGDTVFRTGNIEGNTVYLSGAYVTNSEISSGMQSGLNQAGIYGATVTVTTNTGSGKGTISGNAISYKGSGSITGKINYFGTNLDFSMSMSENSIFANLSASRSRMSDEESEPALSPTDLAVDLLVKAIKEKVDDLNK